MFKGQFNSKTLVATGAASGMGLLLCEKFLEYGGNAVLVDVNEKALNEHVKRLDAIYSGRVLGVVCDVRDYNQICAVRDKAVQKFNSIDVLVNLAGGAETRMCNYEGGEFCDIPIEVYDWGLNVNLRAQLYFDHAVLKQMREQKSGLIINIGSITGAEGDGYGMDYPTSKAGLMFGLTKSIAQYGSKYGIRCVCVSPGPVLTRAAMANMKTLLGRAAEPQEIIDLILFIASDKGQFINGENIMIDGGRNAAGRWC
jgi:NAD(P)-dependent dehydrogenase (short-subunit alcohol dehydrogenase family)